MFLIALAGPAGGLGVIVWEELVDAFILAWGSFVFWCQNLLIFFTTPIGELFTRYVPGAWSNMFQSLLAMVSSIFGLELLSLTFIELSLGVALPFILIFTIYRYLKQ